MSDNNNSNFNIDDKADVLPKTVESSHSRQNIVPEGKSSSSSTPSSSLTNNTHPHHYRRRKRMRINFMMIGLIVFLVLILISIFVFNKTPNVSKNNNTSTQDTFENSATISSSTETYYVAPSKNKKIDYEYSTVREALHAWYSDKSVNEAIIVRTPDASVKVYRVGSGRQFTNIKQAVKQWNDDGQPSATIYVDSGVYITTSDPASAKDPLQIVPRTTNHLYIIGEDKDSTIVKSTTGKYIHPAIMVKGGNVTVKNFTFIADHSTNPDFKYREKEGYNSAYAVHSDGGLVSGVVEFDNCNMFSWQSCGLGAGTIEDSHIIVKNCDIRSFTEGYSVDPFQQFSNVTEEEEHAKYVHGVRGAITYHPYAAAKDESIESFTLINSFVYMKAGYCTVRILNNDNKPEFKLCTFIDNNFSNGYKLNNKITIEDGIHLGKNSSGNNINSINKSNSSFSFEIK